jgi:hypothetical protein
MINRELFVCHCEDVEHQFVISFDEEFDEIIIDIHLASLSFWKRLKYGVQYILGKRSKYGHGAFGEVLLNKNQTGRLVDVLKEHYATMNKNLDVN